MREYQKIETLYKFDGTKKKFIEELRNPIVEYLASCPWLVSEKVDGTNIRVYWDGHKVSWSGRTDNSSLPKEVEELLKEQFGESEPLFEQLFGEKEVYLFMECYGGKVQKPNYGGKERLIGFDIMVENIYLDKTTIGAIFNQFGIRTVDFWYMNNLDDIVKFVKEYNLPSPLCEGDSTTLMEGLVCVPAVRLYDHMGHRIIIKVKKKDLADVVH